ncbi:hypothetical protein K488DRAFT_75869 [Vararia minispora EC-137]|uniref:Uncharacterized protein n=1 Tax=Vararia minispora EC-137 TaxID=1314806 RepID=A0ACB8QYM0_9AGAM|nr:hypothetical protein K488DRAFT_75869 [Vararia minispora EC-137]
MKAADGYRLPSFISSTYNPRKGVHMTNDPGLCIVCHTRPKHCDSLKIHDYCSKKRAAKAALSKTREERDASDRSTPSPTVVPGIVEIPKSDARFESISKQFRTSWRHKRAVPTVRAVYEVTSTSSAIAAYKVYRQSLETRESFRSRGLAEGNEQRRWHGTKRRCLLGDPGHIELCTDPECSLCNIIRHSYDMTHIGFAFGASRFGRGIYTSSTSSKSDFPYTRNDGPAITSSFKAMLLNKVAAGIGFKTLNYTPNFLAPPPGYDSVIGEAGSTLNHDELVIYRSDAIIPSYLVVYN